MVGSRRDPPWPRNAIIARPWTDRPPFGSLSRSGPTRLHSGRRDPRRDRVQQPGQPGGGQVPGPAGDDPRRRRSTHRGGCYAIFVAPAEQLAEVPFVRFGPAAEVADVV